MKSSRSADTSTSLRSLFPQIMETSEGFKTNCPRCKDRTMRLYINEEKGVGCCFHQECDWYKDRGGVTAARLRAWFGQRVRYQEPQVLEPAKGADVRLPKEYQLLDELDEDLSESVYDYLESRGFMRKTLRQMRVGYCERGRHWGYIIFPVFNANGEVVYWQGRRFKNREPKFFNPASSKKAGLVYQLGQSTHPKSIILVESIMNALTLATGSDTVGQLIMALLGSSLSDQQLDHILCYEKYLHEIIIAMDGDAQRAAVEMAKRLYSDYRSFAVKIAQFPQTEDINALGRERSWRLIYNAAVYNPRSHAEWMATAENALLRLGRRYR